MTRKPVGRADGGIGPYGSVTRGTVKRGVGDAAPYGGVERSVCVVGGHPHGSPPQRTGEFLFSGGKNSENRTFVLNFLFTYFLIVIK